MPTTVQKHFIIATISFFFAIGCLGLLQFLLLSELDVLVSIPLVLWLISPVLALILLAQLRQWHWIERTLGVVCMVVGCAILTDIPVRIADYWLSVPRVFGGSFLLFFGAAAVLPRGKTKFVAALIAAAIIGFAFLVAQAWLWQIAEPVRPETFENPVAQSIGSFVTLLLAIATPLTLNIKQSASTSLVSSHKHRFEVAFTVICAVVGVTLWFSFAAHDIKTEQQAAEAELNQLFTNFSREIQQQENAIERIIARLQQLDDNVMSDRLLQEDIKNYVNDYPALVGLAVFDAERLIFGNDLTHSLNANGVFQQSAFLNWLAQEGLSHSTATLPPALGAPAPFIMLREALHTSSIPNGRIIAFFDIHYLLNTSNFDSSFARFWKINEDSVLPLDESSNVRRTTLAELTLDRAPALERSYVIEPGERISLLSIFCQNPRLREEAIANQAVLFFSFIFIAVIAVGHRRSLLLQHEQAQLDHTSRYDQVTGLMRRQALTEELRLLSSEEFAKGAMLFINLDGFQPINDSLGTRYGDELLRLVGQRINEIAPAHAYTAHYSSDEFIVYLGHASIDELTSFATDLLRTLRVPYMVAGTEIHLTASVGIGQAKNTENSATELIAQAEFAMRESKRLGGNLVREFSSHMQNAYSRRAYLRTQLQLALDNRALQVYYQPIVDAATHHIVAVESLVRWQQGSKFISPAEFIPIAEQTGQIIPLGEQVLTQVLNDAEAHPSLGALQLSVNVSVQQLQRYEFPQLLAAQLAEHNVTAERMIIELTEGVFIDPTGNHRSGLDELVTMGCQLAIDDFGSGFSSLSYLHAIPAKIIKLDRSFVTDIVHDAERRELVKRIIELCKTLNKSIVAEGIETAEQAKLLLELGVDRMQGFYFHRPMPATELVSRLALEKTTAAD